MTRGAARGFAPGGGGNTDGTANNRPRESACPPCTLPPAPHTTARAKVLDPPAPCTLHPAPHTTARARALAPTAPCTPYRWPRQATIYIDKHVTPRGAIGYRV